MNRLEAYFLGACVVLTGCSGNDSSPSGAAGSGPTTTTGPSGAGGAGGSNSTDGGGGSGGGTACAGFDAGNAMRSSDGIATNHPEIHFAQADAMGALTFDLTSMYFDLLKMPASMSILSVWADVQNRTATQLCVPKVDKLQIGPSDQPIDISAFVLGPAYELEGSTASFVCLEPCSTGVLWGVTSDSTMVPDTLLDTPTTLTYSISGVRTAMPLPHHPDEPKVLSASSTQSDAGGWTLRGKMKAGPGDIHTLVVHVFVRNAMGLIYGELQARPGDLGTIRANSEFDFETDATPAAFTDYVLLSEFLDGPEPPPVEGGVDAGASDASR